MEPNYSGRKFTSLVYKRTKLIDGSSPNNQCEEIMSHESNGRRQVNDYSLTSQPHTRPWGSSRAGASQCCVMVYQ
jgi:hypothetical protein